MDAYKRRENEKVNNSAIILGKGTAEVQCNGLWLCPLQKDHMDLLDRNENHLIGIEPSPSLKLWIRDMFKTDVLQKATTCVNGNKGRLRL